MLIFKLVEFIKLFIIVNPLIWLQYVSMLQLQ